MTPEFRKIAELKGHAGPVYALCKGNRDGTVFSGSSDGFIAEWNLLQPGPEKFSVKIGQPVYSLCRIEEESLLVAGTGQGAFHVVDLVERKEIRLISHHSAALFDIRYNPSKKHLYTVCGGGHFCVWSVPDFRLLIDFPLCYDKVRKVAVSPSGKSVAVACGDHIVREFETEFYNPLRDLNAHSMSANSVLYLSDEVLVSGGKDAYLNFWKSEGEFPFKSVPAHNFAVYDLVQSPDRSLFASASRDKTVKIWNGVTGDFLLRLDRKQFDGHKNSVNVLYWDASTGILVSSGDDRSLIFWERQ